MWKVQAHHFRKALLYKMLHASHVKNILYKKL